MIMLKLGISSDDFESMRPLIVDFSKVLQPRTSLDKLLFIWTLAIRLGFLSKPAAATVVSQIAKTVGVSGSALLRSLKRKVQLTEHIAVPRFDMKEMLKDLTVTEDRLEWGNDGFN